MKKLMILFLLATFSFAQSEATLNNPHVYSTLGDVIYDNVEAIEKLKQIPEYLDLQKKIDKYVLDVKDLKKKGFALESKDKSVNKDEYLSILRKLSKINDSFVRDVLSNFKKSIEIENNELFLAIINSGLINTDAYKQEIITYYLNHSDALEVSPVIQSFLDEDAELLMRTKENKVTKEDIEAAKIKRIREKDKSQQEAIKKSLEDELIQKKREIRKNQKKELSEN